MKIASIKIVSKTKAIVTYECGMMSVVPLDANWQPIL